MLALQLGHQVDSSPTLRVTGEGDDIGFARQSARSLMRMSKMRVGPEPIFRTMTTVRTGSLISTNGASSRDITTLVLNSIPKSSSDEHEMTSIAKVPISIPIRNTADTLVIWPLCR